MALIKGTPGYCRICGGYDVALRVKGRCSVLLNLGYWKEGQAMMLCPTCYEEMEKWTHQICLYHGKQRPMTPEHKEKLAAARRGKKHSEETKKKIGESKRNYDNPLAPDYEWPTQKEMEEERRKLYEATNKSNGKAN